MIKKYDVIIIGAGLGSLSAGALLSLNGKKVAIIEKNTCAGGYAFGFERDGFLFEASLHNFGTLDPQDHIFSIFNELKISDRIEYIPFKETQKLVYPDFEFKSEKGMDRLSEKLTGMFPEEERGIKKLFKAFTKVCDEYREFDKSSVLPENIEKEMPMFALSFPTIAFFSDKPLGDFLSGYIKDPKLVSIFSNLWWYLGINPSSLSAIMYAVPFVSYFADCGGTFKSTSRSLVNALADVFQKSGGEIFCKKEANRIIVENGNVTGVIADNDVFYTSFIISGTSSLATARMSDGEFPQPYLNKLKIQEQSLSAFQIFLGLDCPASSLEIDSSSYSFFGSYDHDMNLLQCAKSDYENCFFSVINHSMSDGSLCNKDESVISLFTLDVMDNWRRFDKAGLKEHEKKVAGIFIERCERYFPGIKKHIRTIETASPATFANISGNSSGAIYGVNQTTGQSGVKRLYATTPVKGLYLAGADIFPGAGYRSVISSGYKVAKHILSLMK